MSVDKGKSVDSNVQVKGTITVTNPNSASVTLDSITDVWDSTGTSVTCSVTGGLTIGPGNTTFPYVCNLSSLPTSDKYNKVTIKWSTQSVGGSSLSGGSDDDSVKVDECDFKAHEINDCVNVSDSLKGTLGSNVCSDKTFSTYSETFTIPQYGCQTYPNTATFTSTDTSLTGSASQSVKACSPLAKDLTVTKTATPSFTRTYAWGITKGVDKPEIDIAQGGSATFNYNVNVTHDSGTDSAWQVSGTITVSNPNSGEAITADVTDAVGDGGTCVVTGGTGVSIPKSGSVTLNYTCTYASAPSPSSGTNTATATWDKAAYFTPDGSAKGTHTFNFGPVSPTIVNGSVTVTDTLGGSLGTVTYTDSSPKTFTYSHTFTGDPAGTCTTHDNTAKIVETNQSDGKTVTVCVGADLTVAKTATPSFTRTFKWGITKGVDKPEIDIPQGGSATFNYTVDVTHDNGTDSAWQVSGTIKVTNPNGWEAITANVTDAVDNSGDCVVTGGTGVSIPAAGSVNLNYTCTYASAPSPSDGTNTATATWDKTTYFTPDGWAKGTHTFDFASVSPTIVDGSVTVTDTPYGSLGTVSYTDSSPKEIPYSETFSEDQAGTCTLHPNTASFTTNTTSTKGSDGKTVKVCVGEDLTVEKDATPSFTRTYTWDIAKAVVPPEIDTFTGGLATFDYTVTVTHDAGTDSHWQVDGTITVTNPNDWEAITADVADAVDNGGDCVVTGGTNVSVDASDSVTLNYSCTYALAPNPSDGTNTATATWDKAAYSTPKDSATGTAEANFGPVSPTIVDGSVTVTDSLEGSLGTVSYTDSSPKEFTYPYTFIGGAAGTCALHPNTASFTTNTTDTTGSDGATATVCVPTGTPGTPITTITITIPNIPGGPGNFTLPSNQTVAPPPAPTPFSQVSPAEVAKQPQVVGPSTGYPADRHGSSNGLLALAILSSVVGISLAITGFTIARKRREARR